ncbi:hypothetical protein J6TS1_26020 [Siminovitchia terrae]|uniref:Uncharacterized protein n=1 Tax=Siminovitchia terrae TaxID=1914933 RepID=A0A429X4W7_SIMTE|nr:hypothetical protein [Siminovitchia terrae]RST58457.1 hypothetical protein D5F11_017595 [Siminovitchia terrae]GIN92235.1 hypothetical protein J22TS1_32860 [Siminovitchia terrae]GIN96732.1 hypothetical protein J6TS1_26020 [Siminovitchia terrae]
MFITLQITIIFSLFFLLLAVRYIQKSNSEFADEIGLGRGIVALLGQSIGLVTFLASSQASYEYGVIGLLGYCLAGLASFLFIYMLLKSNDTMSNHQRDILGAFSWLYQMENIIIAILAGKMIFNLFYGLNFIIALCMLVIFYQFIILARNKKRYPGSLLIVILSLITTVLIPTLVYLRVSVPTVYSGVNFLATDMLILDEPATWLIVFVLCIRFLAHSLLNENFWGIYSKIKKSKRALSFTISSFIWMFLPLSIGTLSFVAKASAVWPALTDEVSFNVVQQFGGQFGVALLVVTLMVIMFSSISYYVVDPGYGRAIKSGTVIIAVLISVLLPDLTILDVMFYFSFIWAAMVPIFSVKNISISPSIAWIAVCASAASGIYFMTQQGLMMGIIIDFLLASCLTVIFAVVRGVKH